MIQGSWLLSTSLFITGIFSYSISMIRLILCVGYFSRGSSFGLWLNLKWFINNFLLSVRSLSPCLLLNYLHISCLGLTQSFVIISETFPLWYTSTGDYQLFLKLSPSTFLLKPVYSFPLLYSFEPSKTLPLINPYSPLLSTFNLSMLSNSGLTSPGTNGVILNTETRCHTSER